MAYNQTFHVPMLLFDAQYADGTPLTHDEVLSQLVTTSPVDKWTFLTQQYHPELGTPCYGLHPCKTASFMAEVLACVEPPSYYLLTFLTLVGPVVGLHIPLQQRPTTTTTTTTIATTTTTTTTDSAQSANTAHKEASEHETHNTTLYDIAAHTIHATRHTLMPKHSTNFTNSTHPP